MVTVDFCTEVIRTPMSHADILLIVSEYFITRMGASVFIPAS
ncbi:hypothetical protein EV190_10189 [Actinorugispora endophytica]|uniref:Uncharacterized protein n=1 Tax=Actinorugispora endophytica TaxID=1605990 RepID=A0A4R6V3M8_9ACTN|nr:hypothetical protein EV190_10189 [Actinorugispora endophytica]